MLSSVLRSPRAVSVNVEIMRAFVRLRTTLAEHRDLGRPARHTGGQVRSAVQGRLRRHPRPDDAAGKARAADRVPGRSQALRKQRAAPVGRYHRRAWPTGRTDPGSESEWLTRKRRVDPLLDAAGWPRRKGKASPAFRTEEEETAHGPADYALWLDDRVVGIVEAKKLTIGPQNVLTQAERYARGLNDSPLRLRRHPLPVPLLHERRGDLVPRRPARAEPLAADQGLPHRRRPPRAPGARHGSRHGEAPSRCRTTTRGCGRTSSRPTRPSRPASPSASATCWSPWPPAPARPSRSSTRSTA